MNGNSICESRSRHPHRWGWVIQRDLPDDATFKGGPPATNCFVGQALASEAAQGDFGALDVFDPHGRTVAVAEVELSGVTRQMLLGTVLIDAAHTALEDAEVAFDGVGVDGDVRLGDVLPALVVDRLVVGDFTASLQVDGRAIGDQPGFGREVGAQNGADALAGHIVHDGAVSAARGPINDAHDLHLGAPAIAARLLGLLADVGFVGFDVATASAKRANVASGHRFADTVGQEPRGFHGALQHPLDLTGADALLAGAHQMNDLQPQMQGQVRGLEYGALAHGELAFAGIALAQADPGGFAVQAGDALALAAVRAERTIRPQARFDVLESGGFGLEVRGVENGAGHG